MPLFEYACRECGHRFETLVTASRAPSCPKCTSPDLEKQFSTFGTQAASAAPRFT
jgi:putative FmdB family regulatory protein